MQPSDAPVVEVRRLRKNYQGLRPLRMESLVVRPGERVAISGLDAAAAEAFVNLVAGATLPDEGDVRVFGASTAAIATDREWLASLDRFGLVTERAVLLEAFSLFQNLALPFTLEIDPVPADVAATVAALAEEVGLEPATLYVTTGSAPPHVRIRVHLARALALAPRLLLLEHPTTSLPDAAVGPFAADVARTARRRGLALVALTEDRRFAKAVAERWLSLRPATGEMTRVRRWWF